MTTMEREPLEMLGTVPVYGERPLLEFEEAFSESVTLYTAGRRDQKKFKPAPASIGTHLAGMTQFRIGDKDGACFLQGPIVKGASGERHMNNMQQLEFLILDMDTGTPHAEMRERILGLGIFALIYSTHSNGGTTTEIKRDEIIKRRPKDDQEGDISRAEVVAYLRDVKLWHKAVLDTIEIVKEEHVKGGVMVFVSHIPLEKYRVVMPLAAPYVVADEAPVQKDAIEKWKRLVAGQMMALGGGFDRACTDPSRLFYAPAIKSKDAPKFVEFITGDLLDIHEVDEFDYRKLGKPAVNAFIAAAGGEDDDVDHSDLKTDWVRYWVMKNAARFDAAEYVKDFMEVRQEQGNKVTVECPFDGGHSNAGDLGDMGFYAANAGTGGGAGFTMHCQHDSCKSRYDRINYLDAIVYELDHSPDDLEEYCSMGDDDQVEKIDETTGEEVKPVDEDKLSPEELLEHRIELIKRGDAKSLMRVAEVVVAQDIGDIVMAPLWVDIAKRYGGGIPDVKKLFNKVRAAEKRKQLDAEAEGVECSISADLADQAQAIIKGMTDRHLDTKDPTLFKLEDGNIARVDWTRGAGDARRQLLDREGMGYELSEAVRWYEEGPGGTRKGTTVPTNLLNYFRGMPVSRLPLHTLQRVVKHPIYDTDGVLHQRPGYDRDTSAFIDLTFQPKKVSEKPTTKELDTAYNLIFDEMLVDFPFKDAVDEFGDATRASVLAMLLQPLVRDLISGPTPLFVITKPTPGAGSGLLANCWSWVILGDDAPTSILPARNEEEVSKVITTKLLESSDGIMFFDNVNHHVDSASFASALTSGKHKARLLGGNQQLEANIRHVWLASGNNVTFSNEMTRRIVPIQLVPDEDRPELRTEFKHMDLRNWVLDHRADLIWALCTIINNWVAQGMPRFSARKMGTFEGFAGVVGGIIEAFGMDLFLANVPEFIASGSDDTDEPGIVFGWILENIGAATDFTSGDVFTQAWDEEARRFEIPVPLNGHDEDGKRKSWGKKLKSMTKRVVKIDGIAHELVVTGKHTKQRTSLFQVRKKVIRQR